MKYIILCDEKPKSCEDCMFWEERLVMANNKPLNIGDKVIVKKSVTHFALDEGNGTKMQEWVPGSTFDILQVRGSLLSIGIDSKHTGWVHDKDIYRNGQTFEIISSCRFNSDNIKNYNCPLTEINTMFDSELMED